MNNKFTRTAFWLIAWSIGLLIAAGLVVMAFKWHMREKVRAYRESLEERGEKLDIASLSPPTPPTEGNGGDAIVQSAKDLATLIKREGILRILPTHQTNAEGTQLLVHKGERVFCIDPSTSSRLESDWKRAESGIEQLKPLFSKMLVEARSPLLEIHPDYSKGFAAEIPGIREGLISGQYLLSRAMTSLRAGDIESATDSVEISISLARMFLRQRFLISRLVGQSLVGIAQHSTWEILQNEGTSGADLLRLQKLWEGLDLFEQMPETIRMERAAGLVLFKTNSNGGMDMMLSASAHAVKSPGFSPEHILGQAKVFLWMACFQYTDQLSYLTRNQALIELIEAGKASGSWKESLSAAQKLEARGGQLSSTMLTDMSFPTMSSSSMKAASTQALANLTLCAIALKRYLADEGKLPKHLDDLVPKYLRSVPKDPFDGKDLRYKHTAGNGYLLYSIGENCVDENGDASRAKKHTNNILGKDIVWPRPEIRAGQ